MSNSSQAALERNQAPSPRNASIADIWNMVRDWAWTQLTARQRAAEADEARRAARLIDANEPSLWSSAAVAANSQLDHAVLEACRKLRQQLEVEPVAQQKRAVGQ